MALDRPPSSAPDQTRQVSRKAHFGTRGLTMQLRQSSLAPPHHSQVLSGRLTWIPDVHRSFVVPPQEHRLGWNVEQIATLLERSQSSAQTAVGEQVIVMRQPQQATASAPL